MREAVAHQHTQLLEAKAIIKQQGKELHDKDSEFEALKAFALSSSIAEAKEEADM